MDVKVTKVGDGRIRKFVGGRWFNLHRDERFANVQAAALINEWQRLRLCGASEWPEEAKGDPATFVDRLCPITGPVAPSPVSPAPQLPAAPSVLPPSVKPASG